MRKLVFVATLAAGLGVGATPSPAEACGGFFCGVQPVDQQAERIIFAVGEGQTTMITQISYQGQAADFAWVLPLAEVPAVESLDTFPQAAMTAFDANTGPNFLYPEDCWGDRSFAGGAPEADSSGSSGGDGGVTVHIREEVGPYDVAVIESEDPGMLVEWLRTNEFRVTQPMEPYISLYTEEGMKFLALRLQPDAEVNDIAPFRLTLPGEMPSVPLRLTALAAEPEMGIAVFILGDMRYTPANVPELEVENRDIRWSPYTWPLQTNWTALVAKEVDESMRDVGRPGFVTEMAGPTEPIAELARNTFVSTPEQEEARDALVELLEAHPYLTRMYTRMAAEEMVIDPSFRRTDGGDVSRDRMLPRYVDGQDMCGGTGNEQPSPCDFTTCGAGGLCREAENADGTLIASCACAPGTTARTTFAPDGSVTVACQDQRLSFVNPGDRETPESEPLPDPCTGFDCGTNGRCVAMNMTPTCQCDQGFTAVGALAADGSRQTTCVEPLQQIPDRFYQVRLPELPASMPGGREVLDLPETEDPVTAPYETDGGCTVGGHGAESTLPLLGWALIGLLAAGRRPRRRRRQP